MPEATPEHLEPLTGKGFTMFPSAANCRACGFGTSNTELAACPACGLPWREIELGNHQDGYAKMAVRPSQGRKRKRRKRKKRPVQDRTSVQAVADKTPICTITTPHGHSSLDDPIICAVRGDETAAPESE